MVMFMIQYVQGKGKNMRRTNNNNNNQTLNA